MWPIRAQPGDLVKMVQPHTHTHTHTHTHRLLSLARGIRSTRPSVALCQGPLDPLTRSPTTIRKMIGVCGLSATHPGLRFALFGMRPKPKQNTRKVVSCVYCTKAWRIVLC